MRGARVKVGLAIVAIVAVLAVAPGADPGESETPEPTEQSAADTEAAEEILPAIPDAARVRVEPTLGAGNSEVYEFTPRGVTYTIAMTCTSSVAGAEAQLVNFDYPDAASVIGCDGVTTSTIVSAPPGANRIQVRAGDGSDWALSIYDGTPEGVSVTPVT